MKNLMSCILICILVLYLPFLNKDTEIIAETNNEININKIKEKNKQINIKESIYKCFSNDKSLRIVNINDDTNEIYIEISANNLNADTEKSFTIIKTVESLYKGNFDNYTFAYINEQGKYLFKSDYPKENLIKLDWDSTNIDIFKNTATNIFIDPSYQ